MAFAGLGGIKQLWDQCGRPAPETVKIVLDGFELLLKGVNAGYSQQSTTNSRALLGTCQPDTGAAPVASEAQAIQDLQALFGRLAERLHLRIPDLLFSGIGSWFRELLFQHLILTGYWHAVNSSPGVAPIPNPFRQGH
jgi:hypothetical protein